MNLILLLMIGNPKSCRSMCVCMDITILLVFQTQLHYTLF